MTVQERGLPFAWADEPSQSARACHRPCYPRLAGGDNAPRLYDRPSRPGDWCMLGFAATEPGRLAGDIRSMPKSRHIPHFGREALIESLAEAGSAIGTCAVWLARDEHDRNHGTPADAMASFAAMPTTWRRPTSSRWSTSLRSLPVISQ